MGSIHRVPTYFINVGSVCRAFALLWEAHKEREESGGNGRGDSNIGTPSRSVLPINLSRRDIKI